MLTGFLRSAPRSRLIAATAALAAIGAGATATANALGGSGPIAPAKPLASAIRDALGAPAVQGLTASISFTNNLIGSAGLTGAPLGQSPLVTGGTGSLWLAPGGRIRIDFPSDSGDSHILSDGHTLSVYDGASDTLYRYRLNVRSNAGGAGGAGSTDAPPSLARIRSSLDQLARRFSMSGAQPGDTAGQPSYTVSLAPRHDGGLIGHVEIAWDAAHGTPLRLAVYAAGEGSPTLELAVTGITYGPVDPTIFDLPAPPGAHVGNISTPPKVPAAQPSPTRHSAPSFTPSTPAVLVGLPRKAVRQIVLRGKEALVAVYGQGLGAIVVLEQRASGPPSGGAGALAPGPSALPEVSINGATGTELATPLGTLLTFHRDGVAYTILGSIPPAAAEAAARGL